MQSRWLTARGGVCSQRLDSVGRAGGRWQGVWASGCHIQDKPHGGGGDGGERQKQLGAIGPHREIDCEQREKKHRPTRRCATYRQTEGRAGRRTDRECETGKMPRALSALSMLPLIVVRSPPGVVCLPRLPFTTTPPISANQQLQRAALSSPTVRTYASGVYGFFSRSLY